MSDLTGYFHRPTSYFKYATPKRLGLPTGSGITEGACKSMIAMRAKRSGQRWRREGIEAVLAVRSIHQSDRLGFFWTKLARRQHVNIVTLP